MTPEECFEKALIFVLKWEGGYAFRKDDPGGETNFGISKRAHPSIDIKNLTQAQAGEIYKDEYWEKVGSFKHAEYGEYKLAITLFDSAVNCGVRRSLEWLLKAHTVVGQNLPQSTHSKTEQVLLNEVLRQREEHYKRQNKPQFLKGWMNRVSSLRTYLQTL